MHGIDWLIVALFLLSLAVVALASKRYTRSVADFLSANRCAGRYLISASDGMVAFGLTSVIMFFEMYYKAGFTAQWWQLGLAPIVTTIYLLGWVFYRFRQTRSLTLLQFFEQRYSKSFRIFLGILSFVVFVITMGIMPGTGARFFIYACGLPDAFSMLGITIPMFPVVTALLLIISLFFTFAGGQIVVMITDFLQAMFCNVVFLILIIFFVWLIPWNTVIEGLAFAPADASMINPFKTTETKTYDLWFFLIWGFNYLFMFPAWQGVQAFSSAAKNPHEARMARILGNVRGIVTYNGVILIPIIAFVLMRHPQFADIASSANARLGTITEAYYRSQVTVPVSIGKIIPLGMFGLFIASMLGAMIASMCTLLHAWGSIFVQDVVLPFRKTPLAPKTHIWLLRLAILGVAVILYLISLFYKQTQDIWLFWAIIGCFYYAGAGAALIFGLYWRRGTTAAAWAGLISGIVLTTIGYLIIQYSSEQAVVLSFGQYVLKLDSQRTTFSIMVISIIAYVVTSLFSKQPPCDFDKLFHCGKYAIEGDKSQTFDEPVKGLKAMGVDKYFTTSDKFVYFAIVINMAITFGAFLVITVMNLFVRCSDHFWSIVWLVYVWNVIISGSIVTIWFLIGGGIDLKDLIRRLKSTNRNDLDDGTVVNHKNLDETK
jgi:SSS family solute:Na+ symporter